MNLERLELLIDVLNGITPTNKQFDMANWLRRDACGTSACAAGYAALDDRFQILGLNLVASVPGIARKPIKSIEDFNEFVMKHRDADVLVTPTFEDMCGFEALEKFFDITPMAGLFDPCSFQSVDVTPQDVIARIHEVIACDGDSPIAAEEEDEPLD